MANPRLELLGGFRLTCGEGRAIDVHAKKNRTLLGFLALAPKFEASRGRLTGLLWAERAEEQARSSLRQALVALRQEMSLAGTGLLQITGDRVSLNSGALTIDICEFLDKAGNTDLESLRQAASLYAGQFLNGLTVADNAIEDWLRETRHELAGLAVAVLETLTRETIGPDRFGHGQRLVELDPLREASHQALIEAYLAEGEKGLARKQFEACKLMLRRELAVEPGEELSKLFSTPEGRANGAAAVRATDRKPVIAVLPLENLNGESPHDYFSDGITEDIIDRLSRFRTLSVIGRHSSFAFRGSVPNAGDIREILKADYVATGNIRKSNGRIRVAVRLSDARTNAAIWAEHYDRPLEDVFEVQNEVAHVIASTLVGHIETEIRTQSGKKHSLSLSSYEQVLQGFWHFNLLTPAANDRAILCFERALELDPHNADAQSWLASAFLNRWWSDFESNGFAKAIALATEAVRYDPANFNGHRALAMSRLLANGVEAAKPSMLKAIALNPGASHSLSEMALLSAYEGELQQARGWLDQAFRLNPLPPLSYAEIGGIILFIEGEYEAALRALEAIPDSAWDMMYALSCCGHLGLIGKARAGLGRFRLESRISDFLQAARAEPYRNPEPRERLIAGLAKALAF